MKHKKLNIWKSVLYILAVIALVSVTIASGTFTVLALNSKYLKLTPMPTVTPAPTTTIVPSPTATPTSNFFNQQANTNEACVTFTNLDTGEKKCIYRYEIAKYGISPEQFEAKRQNPNQIIINKNVNENSRYNEMKNKLNDIENKQRQLESGFNYNCIMSGGVPSGGMCL